MWDNHRFYNAVAMSGYEILSHSAEQKFLTLYTSADAGKMAGYTVMSYSLGKFNTATSAFFTNYRNAEDHYLTLQTLAMTEYKHYSAERASGH